MRPGLSLLSATRKAVAPSGPPPEITDDFNRADGGLGANWAIIPGGSALAIASNRVTAPGAGCMGNHVSQVASADHYAQATLLPSVEMSVLVRVDITTGDFYMGRWGAGATGWEIFRRLGGVYTQIAVASEAAPASGTVLRMEVQGSALRLYAGGALKVSTTDSNIVGFRRVGMRGNSGAVADNFAAGSL